VKARGETEKREARIKRKRINWQKAGKKAGYSVKGIRRYTGYQLEAVVKNRGEGKKKKYSRNWRELKASVWGAEKESQWP